MNNLDKQYQELLQDILDNGVRKGDRTGTGTISVFSRQIRHKMSDGFPLLTTKKMYWKGIVTELLWFLRGDTNIKFLVDNDCHIWDGDAYKNYLKEHLPENGTATMEEFIALIKQNEKPEYHELGELGPIYGKQWRTWVYDSDKWREEYKKLQFGSKEEIEHLGKKGIDQIANLIRDLKTNPDSRRLMVNAWNVGELDLMVLPPCHYGFQVYTRELSLEERCEIAQIDIDFSDKIKNYLDEQNIPTRAISLMWNQRSIDSGLGLPFNLASYGLLLEILAKEVNMVPDELIGNLGDTHLYLNHIDGVKEQLTREPYELPKLICKDEYWYLNDVDISFSEKIEKFKPDFFKVEDYQSHPTIKMPLSN
jgi:thymidylate synthase